MNGAHRDGRVAQQASQRVLLDLVDLQIRRPFAFAQLAVALCIPAALLARQLELRTAFDSLLPENKPSVTELHRVTQPYHGTGCTDPMDIGTIDWRQQ